MAHTRHTSFLDFSCVRALKTVENLFVLPVLFVVFTMLSTPCPTSAGIQKRTVKYDYPQPSWTKTVISVPEYFPEINNDLTKVTWAHAVNNRAKLNASLQDDSVMMIEADIMMGQLEGSPAGTNPIPIMSHPPQTISDLSLEEFLTTILNSGKRKGIKLDFKSKDVFVGSENILEEIIVKPTADFPIWLNADILPGPVDSPNVPVDPDYFVGTVIKKFASAMLSIGWTTRFGGDITLGSYSHDNIGNMTDVLARNAVTQPVTFPVRAALAAHSGAVLTSLVRTSVAGTTLTIWMSNDADKVDVEALKQLINDLGHDKVYLDLPPHIMEQFNNNGGAANIKVATGLLVACCISLLSMLSFY